MSISSGSASFDQLYPQISLIDTSPLKPTFSHPMPSMKLRMHPPIPDPIDAQLKHQARTLNPHIEREIQIIKLDALCRRQPREQTLGHSVQVGSKRAHVDKPLAKRIRCHFGVAGYQVVFDGERLARPEIPRVVEGYRGGFGDLRALVRGSGRLASWSLGENRCGDGKNLLLLCATACGR